MFRVSSVPIIRSYQLYTWQLVCFMQVMWPLPRTVRFQPDSPRQRLHNLHETYQLLSLQLITPDDGNRRCSKHVEFRDKIKLWIIDASCWSFIRRNVASQEGLCSLKVVMLLCSYCAFVSGPYEDFSWRLHTWRCCLPSMSGFPYPFSFHYLCKFICLSSGSAKASQKHIPLARINK